MTVVLLLLLLFVDLKDLLGGLAGMAANTFNPRCWEAEACRSLSPRTEKPYQEKETKPTKRKDLLSVIFY